MTNSFLKKISLVVFLYSVQLQVFAQQSPCDGSTISYVDTTSCNEYTNNSCSDYFQSDNGCNSSEDVCYYCDFYSTLNDVDMLTPEGDNLYNYDDYNPCAIAIPNQPTRGDDYVEVTSSTTEGYIKTADEGQWSWDKIDFAFPNLRTKQKNLGNLLVGPDGVIESTDNTTLFWLKINKILNGGHEYLGSGNGYTCNNCWDLTIGGETYWFSNSYSVDPNDHPLIQIIRSACSDNMWIPYYQGMYGYNGIPIRLGDLKYGEGQGIDYQLRTDYDDGWEDAEDFDTLVYSMYDYQDMFDYLMSDNVMEWTMNSGGNSANCSASSTGGFCNVCARPSFSEAIDYTEYDWEDEGGERYCRSDLPDFTCHWEDGEFVTYNAWGTNGYPCVVYGCTNIEATNYNAKANFDKHDECTFQGCTDSLADNYLNPSETIIYSQDYIDIGGLMPNGYEVGQEYLNPYPNDCEYIGCSVEYAYNYKANYTEQADELCEFYGCKDEAMFNYLHRCSNNNTGVDCTETINDPSYHATLSCTSCCEDFNYGCIDENSYYFESNANTDDESCITNPNDIQLNVRYDTALTAPVIYWNSVHNDLNTHTFTIYRDGEEYMPGQINHDLESSLIATIVGVYADSAVYYNINYGEYNGLSNQQYFIDDNAGGNCTTHTYQLLSKSEPVAKGVKGCPSDAITPCFYQKWSTNGTDVNRDDVEITINLDVTNTWVSDNPFLESKQLNATKGDYENRVELSWSNNNNGLISSFDILRRNLVDNVDMSYSSIGETSNSVHHFTDYNANANKLYEYKIVAKILQCNSDDLDDSNNTVSNESESTSTSTWNEDQYSEFYSNIDVGFRIPYSNVYGRITYEDGTSGVGDVQVYAEQTNASEIYDHTLILDGTFNNQAILETREVDDFSFMTWLKPDSIQSGYFSILSPLIDDSYDQNAFSCIENESSYMTNESYCNSSGINEMIIIDSDGSINSLGSKYDTVNSSSNIEYYDQNSKVSFENWQHLAITFNATSSKLKVYLNGDLIQTHIGDFSSLSNICLGNYMGNLDEISIWETNLSDDFIKEKYNKFLKRNEEGILAYYKCNEGAGSYIYDLSVNSLGSFNHNHLPLNYSLDSSNNIVLHSSFDDVGMPDGLINFSSLSNSTGYYVIEDISYPGSGATFDITPFKAAIIDADGSTIIEPSHEFEATHSSIYLSDGGNVANIDFTDISSFTLTGRVKFLDPNTSSVSLCTDVDGGPYISGSTTYLNYCDDELYKVSVGVSENNYDEIVSSERSFLKSEGVAILIDGEYLLDSNGDTILSDADGYFSIQVPIGKHQISVYKEGHTFVESIWKTTNHTTISDGGQTLYVYNFISNFSDELSFYDNTKRTLIGRVCGGATEGNKPFYGTSINNIGVSTFVLSSLNDEHYVYAQTDSLTGEYSVNLLPTLYNVAANVNEKEFYVNSNPGAGDSIRTDLMDMVSIDISKKVNNVRYSTNYYDNIITKNSIIEYGEIMILDPMTLFPSGILEDSIQTLHDTIINQYIEKIDNPNSISIFSDASDSNPDDFYNYPLLFGIDDSISHDLVLQWRNDSIEYDYARNFVQRTSPTISFYSSKYVPDNNFPDSLIDIVGDSEYVISSQELIDTNSGLDTITIIDTIPLINNDGLYQFGLPVFTKGSTYEFQTSVSENYTNYDNDTIITFQDILSEGTLTLSDGRATSSYSIDSILTRIPFTPIDVNTSLNGDDSFEQNFTITYISGSYSKTEPVDYYVFGSRADSGLNYFTTGPDIVEMVLRDPPGDASYSYIESGSSLSNSIILDDNGPNYNNNNSSWIGKGINTELAFPLGGPQVFTSFLLNYNTETLTNENENNTDISIDEVSLVETFSTSSQEYNVGSGGDIYIADAYNLLYGTSKILEIVKVEDCSLQGYVCYGETSDNSSALGMSDGVDTLYTKIISDSTGVNDSIHYTLGTIDGIEVNPVGYKTKTVYDQNFIVQVLIPSLKLIRNSYFALPAYQLTDTLNPCYYNLLHDLYNKDTIPNPCYTYYNQLDDEDPFTLPFNVYADVNLEDYIPSGFINLIQEALSENGGNNGEYRPNAWNQFVNEINDILQEGIDYGIEAEETNVVEPYSSELDNIYEDEATIVYALTEILNDGVGGASFGAFISSISLLNDIEDWKDNVIDDYDEYLNQVEGGLELLTDYLNNLNVTIPNNKVNFYNQQITKWEDAVKANEEDKASIFDDGTTITEFTPEDINFDTFGPDQNYSLSAGNSIEESYRSVRTDSRTHTIDYTLDVLNEVEFGVAAMSNGQQTGTGYSEKAIFTCTFDVRKTTTDTETDYTEFGYVLSDNDEDDYISIDVKDSNEGWGPIFRKRAGATRCPFEAEEEFIFYPHSDSTVIFSPSTQPREVPGIDIEPKVIVSVPESEAAVFNLQLTNNSATSENIVYTLMVNEASNPHGAIIKMDGLSVYRDIMVPYNTTINKTLTVEKGADSLNYQDLEIILRSQCQYDYGTASAPDIADSVKFSVSFLAECTDVSIVSPADNWVYNISDTTNDFFIEIDDYNWNHYSLDDISIQWKESNQNDNMYSGLGVFCKDTLDSQCDDLAQLLSNEGSFKHEWEDISLLEDGSYDIRVVSTCGDIKEYSEVHTGVKDTKKPETFGTPQPADGILSPNDDIYVNWSEPINVFYISENISMKGVKNITDVSHNSFVYLDTENKLNIPSGVNLQNSSFTVEMYLSPQSQGTLFEQGYDNNRLKLFLDEYGHIGVEYQALFSQQTATSDSIVIFATDNSEEWNHIAFVFDNDLKTISFYIRGELSNVVSNFNMDYTGEGSINIGGDGTFGIHEYRIWSNNRSLTNVIQNLSSTLTGSEVGLKGYWPMDELSGQPKDQSRYRHMTGEFNWAVTQKGYGYDCSNNILMNAPINSEVYDASDNFTIEFWFKSNSGINECMVSTGSYNTTYEYGNLDAWSIGLGNSGNIYVQHNLIGSDSIILTSNQEFNDGIWHHLALVKDAKSNTTLYIDQVDQASCSSDITRGFSSDSLTIGAKQYKNFEGYEYSEAFRGKIDELRVWRLKRTVDQLSRYHNIRLDENEIGLGLYFPFETYQTFSEVNILVSNSMDITGNIGLVPVPFESEEIYSLNEDSYISSDLPLIKMVNPYEEISFHTVVNQDAIMFHIDEDMHLVEGIIIDLSIEGSGIKDLYSNSANSVSWSFYVDKNQLVWDDNSLNIEKKLGEPLVVNANIINQGGTIESFEISNLPSWLSASPSYGLLDPNSSTSIEFIVQESLFIGDYEEQIQLIGNNEYPEILTLNLNVESGQPEYDFLDEDYEYSMNFIGEVLVDGVSSRDDLDILVAYVDDEVRGYTSPLYLDDYDSYFVFLTVFSNSVIGDSISFRLWDASEGKTQSQVYFVSQEIDSVVSIEFEEGKILGDFQNLVSFETSNTLRQEIELIDGWNWISLNLEAEDQSPMGKVMIPTIMNSVNSSSIEVLKGIDEFSQYADNFGGWLGSMDNKMTLGSMYKLKINENDTIIYEGFPVDLSNSIYNIDIEEGWNWIGYLGQRPLDINSALSSLNPVQGDIIKGYASFSMFASESIGWLGTLNTIEEGKGYMLKTSQDQLLVYPENSLYGANNYRLNNNQQIENHWLVDNSKYETSMSIVAKIDHPKYDEPNKKNVLGAFNGNSCLGNINSTLIDEENSLYFLTVYGNSEDNITFKYYDEFLDKNYISNNSVSFESNAVIGSINQPYLIEIDLELQNQEDYFMINVHPNPIKDLFEIEFYLLEHSMVEIELYDITGRMINSLYKAFNMIGLSSLKFDTDQISEGVYILDFKINERSYQKRIIKK